MGNKYTELKAKYEKLLNDFPMGFAFTQKQLDTVMEKLEVSHVDELLRIPGSGFIRKSDKDAYRNLFLKWDEETKEAMKDDDYVLQGFEYELANHEFCITGDPEDTFSALGLTNEEVKADERLTRIYKKARLGYMASCDIW